MTDKKLNIIRQEHPNALSRTLQKMRQILLRNYVTLITYHYFSEKRSSRYTCGIDDLIIQLWHLKNNYNIIPLYTALQLAEQGERIPSGSVSILIDDCVESLYNLAWPILSSLKIHVHCNLITGAIGNYIENGVDQKIISGKQISTLLDSGLVTFGSHSMRHKHFKNIDQNSIYDDVKQSKKIIESYQGHCDFFCYPYGDITSISLASECAIKAAGYKYALTTLGGVMMKGVDRYRIGRVNINNSINKRQLTFYANGMLGALTLLKRRATCNTHYSNKSPGGFIGSNVIVE